MRTKNLTIAACLLFLTAPIFSSFAQKPAHDPIGVAPPEITPAPSASPTIPSPTPAATPQNSAPAVPKPSPQTTRAIIDSLSQTEVQEVISALKSNYLSPSSLKDEDLARATLEGLFDRLSPGASISQTQTTGPAEPSPFRAEILDDRIGYLRLGTLEKNNVAEMDAALKNFTAKSLKSAVLDLRATPASSDFDQAAEVIKRFCPKGNMLFTIKKPSAKQERIFTSNQDPQFQGVLIVIVDRDTTCAGEVIAAVLRIHAKALILGEKTAGQAVEYAELPLRNGRILRVAVAEITLPESVSIFPNGVKPDLLVQMPDEAKRELLQQELEKGVSQFVFESERPRMNEAALVAGTNPELDALEAAQRNRSKPKTPLRDVVVQRAVDLITTIGIYESKPPRAEK